MTSITANELKTKGISAIEALLEHQPETVISVRGKDRIDSVPNSLRHCSAPKSKGHATTQRKKLLTLRRYAVA
ncbi:MAG: type II toxin-antitoxin system Phd/YefM family antitoxin [Proteobacteria bacterium]|nr:type II toxin-antitoxin system Phd/YefM family antitoxin [Pseudomonadota bacterium]